jgi:protein-S-isoprenylcysteine O-methyltransferase Ste14
MTVSRIAGGAIASVLLLVVAVLIFRRVRNDYQTHGKLTPFAGFLEVLIFFLHGSSSYVFLDSTLAHINTRSPLFAVAVFCMFVGLGFTLTAMTRLGMRQSVGGEVTGLRESGFYRYTRNPQIVAYALVVIGYALLWPSWLGLLWVGVYAAIAHIMVRTEEEHLRKAYGEAYERYCARTPRYIGL